MNRYASELDIQRRQRRLVASGRRAYELRDLNEVVARRRREQRERVGQALAALFKSFRRPRRERSALPTALSPAEGGLEST